MSHRHINGSQQLKTDKINCKIVRSMCAMVKHYNVIAPENTPFSMSTSVTSIFLCKLSHYNSKNTNINKSSDMLTNSDKHRSSQSIVCEHIGQHFTAWPLAMILNASLLSFTNLTYQTYTIFRKSPIKSDSLFQTQLIEDAVTFYDRVIESWINIIIKRSKEETKNLKIKIKI